MVLGSVHYFRKKITLSNISDVLHVQDPESGYGGLSDSFSEKSVRLGFIRKVYSILSVQLVVTMAIIGIFRIDSVVRFSGERNSRNQSL